MGKQNMRNLHLEAAIWNLFTSLDFFEAAARECESTMSWFGTLDIARNTASFDRNDQVYDKFKQRARDLRRGAEMARLGDYKLIWDISDSIRGDVRGMMEQPLHSWMTEAEYREFECVKISRLLAYAGQITRALNNGMVKGSSFFRPNPDCPERSNDDDGFPEDYIVKAYESNLRRYKDPLFSKLPDPLPEYVIDRSIACQTGDEVPWTGVWYPDTGLEKHSLTFAIKGIRMQPAFRVTKTVEELKRVSDGAIVTRPETIAVATTWHPVIPSGRHVEPGRELQAKAGQPCPKAGIWQPMEPGAASRAYGTGEPMMNLGSAYGLTVWRWVADR
jgi:hypothetical protein